MLSAVALYTCGRVWCSAAQRHVRTSYSRAFSTPGKGGSGDEGKDADEPGDDINSDKEEEEEEDEFGLSGFDIKFDEAEDLESKLEDLTEATEEVTPELASKLVAKMVESASRSLTEKSPAKGDVISAITPHTISVLRASRISTNAVQASGSDMYRYPITNKVSAQINIEDLGLSRSAEEALKYLSGPRVRGDVVKFSANKFPSQAENHAYAVSLIDRLVVAAKSAVGETVDSTALETWEDVVEEVKRQAGEEVVEAGSVSLLLGESKN